MPPWPEMKPRARKFSENGFGCFIAVVTMSHARNSFGTARHLIRGFFSNSFEAFGICIQRTRDETPTLASSTHRLCSSESCCRRCGSRILERDPRARLGFGRPGFPTTGPCRTRRQEVAGHGRGPATRRRLAFEVQGASSAGFFITLRPLRFCRRSRLRFSGFLVRRSFSTDHLQIVTIKSGQGAFQIGIGPRLVGFRVNSLLRQLTDMPVLTVDHVPEFDCI